MSRLTGETLYKLLPAIYRIRDEEQGGPLRALIDVLATQGRVVEDDIDRLYDNLFIETCDEWVVPYIGDLLGVGHLYTFTEAAPFSQRARVANTLAYRRRKGTASMLEGLAFDTTGWRARAVEFFERLGTTQHLNHVRLHNLRTPDLRDAEALEQIETAFDAATYTADVRPIGAGAARPNIPNIGVYLWRLGSYAFPRRQARPMGTPPDGRYTFHPLGIDSALANRPQTEADITRLAGEINVPAPLRRRALYDELEARRQALAEGRTPVYRYFDDRPGGAHPPVFDVFFDEEMVDGRFVPVRLDEVMICDLSAWDSAGWTRPGAAKIYPVVQPDGTTVEVSMPVRVAVDPVLGRLALPLSESPGIVHVSYAYNFSGDVGGGPYNRRLAAAGAPLAATGWQVAVGRPATLVALGATADNVTFFTSLVDAVVAWNGQTQHAAGTIALLDNSTFEENLTGAARIEVREGQRLTVVAADWPAWLGGGPLVPDERQAHLRGAVEVVGTAPAESADPGEITLSGVMVENGVTVLPGHLGQLSLAHATLAEGVTVDDSDAARPNASLCVQLDRCLSGPLVVPATIREVRLTDTLVHAHALTETGPPAPGASLAGNAAATAPGPRLYADRCTLLGRVHVVALVYVSSTIFVSPVVADRLQEGCVRFSYVPPLSGEQPSRTPRRYRCQPDLALDARAEALGVARASLPPAEARLVQMRLVPSFTSLRYGDGGFGQLGSACPPEIVTGAEDGSEMGVFSFLKAPQRLSNLRASLDEYLRLGLEAGLLFAT